MIIQNKTKQNKNPTQMPSPPHCASGEERLILPPQPDEVLHVYIGPLKKQTHQ